MPRTNPAALVSGLLVFGLALLAAVPARGQAGGAEALAPAPAPSKDPAAALKQVAAQLFTAHRYRDALAQLQAAYAVQRPAPPPDLSQPSVALATGAVSVVLALWRPGARPWSGAAARGNRGLWAGAYRHPETRVAPYEPQTRLAPLGSTDPGGLAVGVRF